MPTCVGMSELTVKIFVKMADATLTKVIGNEPPKDVDWSRVAVNCSYYDRYSGTLEHRKPIRVLSELSVKLVRLVKSHIEACVHGFRGDLLVGLPNAAHGRGSSGAAGGFPRGGSTPRSPCVLSAEFALVGRG